MQNNFRKFLDNMFVRKFTAKKWEYLFNVWIINIWNKTNTKNKFLSNSSFQDLMVLCCKKWWKLSWWYRYFSSVLNIFDLAKIGNIIGNRLFMNVILALLRLRFSFWFCYFFYFLFFSLSMCICTIFGSCFSFFQTHYKLNVFFYQVFKIYHLTSPSKTKPHEIKDFLTCPHWVRPPWFLHPSENKNYLILRYFLQIYLVQIRRRTLL